MAAFKRLPQHQLARLSDVGLVDYVDGAREAGDLDAQREAIGYLAFAFEPVIRARVRGKVPTGDVDDVVMEVLLSVTRAAFGGKLVGQFGAFVRTITKRRIADHYRERERRPQADPLGGEGEDDVWGADAEAPDETGAVDFLDAVARALAECNPLHRKVIRLYGAGVSGFEDLSASEVCERIAADGDGDRMTVDNVAKIWSRFKQDLREQLDG